MKRLKTLFYTLLYLGLTYLFLYLFMRFTDYVEGFNPDTHLDHVNYIFMIIFNTVLAGTPFFFGVLAVAFAIQLFKKKGRNG